jgi:hypothetical protein
LLAHLAFVNWKILLDTSDTRAPLDAGVLRLIRVWRVAFGLRFSSVRLDSLALCLMRLKTFSDEAPFYADVRTL